MNPNGSAFGPQEEGKAEQRGHIHITAALWLVVSAK